MHRRNTRRDGRSFTAEEVLQVWVKGVTVPGYDPSLQRKDRYGAWILRSQYGDTAAADNSGWEVDHIRPVALGGGDELANLQPLQWENNRRKGDGPGTGFDPVKAG